MESLTQSAEDEFEFACTGTDLREAVSLYGFNGMRICATRADNLWQQHIN